MKNKIKTIFIFIGIIAFLLTLFFEAFAAPPLKRRPALKKRPVIKRRFVPGLNIYGYHAAGFTQELIWEGTGDPHAVKDSHWLKATGMIKAGGFSATVNRYM